MGFYDTWGFEFLEERGLKIKKRGKRALKQIFRSVYSEFS